MKILLDTHTVLWWINEYGKLSKKAKFVLMDEENELYLSIASLWEIAIKISLNKLTNLNGGVDTLLKSLEMIPIELIPIQLQYIKFLESLPFIHRDPFDRLLIATAKMEDMTILTADKNLCLYNVLTIW